MPNVTHIVIAVVFIAIGLYIGAKNPGLLSKVTAGTVSA